MTSYPCPSCRTPADLTSGCPGCGRGPDRDAAEVVRLDAEIPVLTARLATAREAVTVADKALRYAWQSRQAAIARIQAALAVPAPMPAGPPLPVAPPRTKETSTKLVQNVLFLLGGLLLGVAAIVFTAVAWSQFGVGGRALLLAAFTAAALGAPFLALRRKLTATAETFAALGLLLLLLDGYAAWYVNLFGVADYSALGYAGAVCAVTAAVAAGYEHVTGLIGPRFAALLVAQPVLPLLMAPVDPGASLWAYTMVGVCVLDLAVIHLRRSALTPLGITAYVLGALATVGAGLSALVALVIAQTNGEVAVAASALIAAAGVPVIGAVLARVHWAQAVTGGLFVVALAVAGCRFAATAGSFFLAPVLMSAVVAALAVLVTLVNRALPAPVRRGPWAGALVVVVSAGSLGLAFAGLDRTVDWRLPAVIGLLTAALTVLVPRVLQPHVMLGGAALVAVVAPAAFDLRWWTAPMFDLVVVAAALVLALWVTAPWPAADAAAPAPAQRGTVIWPAAVAAVLTAHAVIAGFERPGVAAATLAAVSLLGCATALAARRGWVALGDAAAVAAGRDRDALGGVALVVGLLAAPAAVWQTAASLSASGAVQSRLALAAVALLAGAVHLIKGRYVQVALLLGVVSVPAWALASGDSPAIYAAVGLLVIAAAAVTTVPARFTAALLGVALAVAAAASLGTVLVAPYRWLPHAWTGVPAGTGVGRVSVADVVALGVFALAVVVAVEILRGRRAAIWAVAPVLAVIAPMGFAAAGVPWPGVPAESLLIGVAGLLAVALLRPATFGSGGFGATAAGLTGVALAGAGLAGALPTEGATLGGLALVLVAGVVAGVAGREQVARLIGWLVAAGATVGFAVTVGRLAGWAPAFPVLGAAALVLAAGTMLAGRRAAGGLPASGGLPAPGGRVVAVEGVALQAAGHAGAFVALLFTAGSIRRAAAVCTLWGLALGLRALRPRENANVRHGHVVAAAGAVLGGWWLLITAEQVAILEAYTVPAAAVALLAGWLARRSRAGLSSWVTFGPALAAALLPTLASVLVSDGAPVRRLVLGLGALAVLLAGARFRLQAPVVVGGGVLAVVALHELVLVWDLLPRWIPLAAAGLLLVGLATTLERRRRDLARVRAALVRMS